MDQSNVQITMLSYSNLKVCSDDCYGNKKDCVGFKFGHEYGLLEVRDEQNKCTTEIKFSNAAKIRFRNVYE